MEMDGLFVSSKWKILQIISNKPSTPQELAQKLNTSLANISQQMRFLEFADLVKKTRIAQDTFGKPKSNMSLKNNFSYVVLVSKGTTKKDIVNLDDFQNMLMSCWLNLTGQKKKSFENFIIDNKKKLNLIKEVYFDGSSNEIFVLTNTPFNSSKKYEDLNFIFLTDKKQVDSRIKTLDILFQR